MAQINSQIIQSSESIEITRKIAIKTSNVSLTGSITVNTGVDGGLQMKNYVAPAIVCGSCVCNNNKSRDISTTSNTVDITIPFSKTGAILENGAVLATYASSVLLPDASIIIRVHKTGDATNYNEYVVETAKYVVANTPYQFAILLRKPDGSLATPSAVGGTGFDSSGNAVIQVIVNSPTVASFTLSLFDMAFVSDPSQLECETLLTFRCINSISANSEFETIVRKCQSPVYSEAAREETIEFEVVGLPESFMYLNPKAKKTSNITDVVRGEEKATIFAKTVNGIDFGAIQLNNDFAGGCNPASVIVNACTLLPTDFSRLCVANASQDIIANEYSIFSESSASGTINYILVDNEYVGKEITYQYNRNAVVNKIEFNDGQLNSVSYDLVHRYSSDVEGCGTKRFELRISNVKSISVPLINRSSSDDVTNTFSLRFKLSDAKIYEILDNE